MMVWADIASPVDSISREAAYMMAQLTSRISHDVSNRYELCISSRMAAIRAKFSGAIGVDPSTDTIEAAVSICCIGCNQFVRITTEFDSSVANQIQQGKFVI
jgi:hypothetical protein